VVSQSSWLQSLSYFILLSRFFSLFSFFSLFAHPSTRLGLRLFRQTIYPVNPGLYTGHVTDIANDVSKGVDKAYPYSLGANSSVPLHLFLYLGWFTMREIALHFPCPLLVSLALHDLKAP
jgi:hypothetical protein